MSDVSNKFLAVEIWLPPVAIVIAGAISYGSLKAEVEHKAEKEDVAVISTKVENIEDDVKEIKDEQKEQRKILDRIDRKLNNGD